MVFDAAAGDSGAPDPDSLEAFLKGLGMGDLFPIFRDESITSKEMLQDMCREDSAYFERDLSEIGIKDESTRLRLMGALMRPPEPPPPHPPSGGLWG